MFEKVSEFFSILGRAATANCRYAEIQDMMSLLDDAKSAGLQIPEGMKKQVSGLFERSFCEILKFRHTNRDFIRMENFLELMHRD